jgi:periplasmic protein TonB
MSAEEFEEEGRGRRRMIGGLIAFAIIGGVISFFFLDAAPATKHTKSPDMVNVTLPPPPPLPSPPPKTEAPPEPKTPEMIEQEPVAKEEQKTEEPPAPEEPPAGLGTGLVGDGPNGFGLTTGRGNGGSGNRIGGNGRRNGGRFDHQAIEIQNTIQAALKRNEKTRHAEFSGQLSLWTDSTGRITKVKLSSSAGTPEALQALRDEIPGLQLPDISGMPMPIHIRLNARKPQP